MVNTIAPIIDGDLIPFRSLTEVIPSHPALQTIYTWLRLPKATRLESIVIGGKRFVTREQLQDFITRRTALSPVLQNPRHQKHRQPRSRRLAVR
jgi:hypothetical protein